MENLTFIYNGLFKEDKDSLLKTIEQELDKLDGTGQTILIKIEKTEILTKEEYKEIEPHIKN